MSSPNSADRTTITLADAETLSLTALMRHGCDVENARAVTSAMIAAERDICESHGLFRLPGYVKSLASGKVNGRARPQLSHPAPAVLVVDGKAGFAQLALETGREPLLKLAREQGVAVLALRDIYHYAALWPEVEWFAERSLVAIACTAATPMVAPAGGTKPFYGTNPLAFGFPRDGAPPVVFDQAAAAMARGDVMIHSRDGKALPAGVGIGPDGQPSTDPDTVLAGAQLAFGGYKGAAIAMMIELLAGAVVGEVFSYEATPRSAGPGLAPAGGEFVLALDPDRFGHGTGWRARAEAFFNAILAQEGTRLPGQRRHRNRALTAQEGIRVKSALLAEIRELAGSQD